MLSRLPEAARSTTVPAGSQSFATGRALGSLSRLNLGRQPAIVFTAVAVAGGVSAVRVIAGLVLILAAYAASAAANDIADLDSDVANGKRARPLVTGALNVGQARSFVRAAVALAFVALAFLAQPVSAFVVVACALGSWAYSCRPIRAKDRPLASLVVLSLLSFVAPVLLAAGQGGQSGPWPGEVLALAGLWLCAAGVAWDKDVLDEAGDRAAGSRTAVVRYGVRRLSRWSPAVCAAGGVVALLGVASAGASVVLPAVAVGLLVAARALIAAHGHVWTYVNASRWSMIVVTCLVGIAMV